MEKQNIVQEKSFRFALKIVELYRKLAAEREYVLSKQILRSGTSIGANIEEATGSMTRKDFAARITIAYKEARETLYWLKILKCSNYIAPEPAENLMQECVEIIKILSKTQKTLKNSTQNIGSVNY